MRFNLDILGTTPLSQHWAVVGFFQHLESEPAGLNFPPN